MEYDNLPEGSRLAVNRMTMLSEKEKTLLHRALDFLADHIINQVTGNYLENVVEDLTPQLGGTLDANGQDIDMGVNLITDAKVGQWDEAYSWGDHAGLYALLSHTHVAADIDAEASADGYVLTSDGAGNAAWEAVPAGGGGEVNTGSSLGGTYPVFVAKVGQDLQFHGLEAGTNISIVDSGGYLTISSTGGSGETNTASNVGTGTTVVDLFKQKTGVDFEFKRLEQGTGVTLTATGTDTVKIDATGAGGGEVNTASNLGAGEGVFSSKSGVDLRFKSLVEGTGIQLGSDTDEITMTCDLTFTEMSDTPASYAGAANKILKVNATATGVEFDSSTYVTNLAGNDPIYITGGDTVNIHEVDAISQDGFMSWEDKAKLDSLSFTDNITISTAAPSGGSDGDIWLRYVP